MIVLVPAYQPDHRLLELLDDLGDRVVLVVDDGSGSAYDPVFVAAASRGAHVLRFRTNRGKGAALKSGFEEVDRRWPGQDVVCADSDGQHRPTDVDRVAARLSETGAIVLGVRRFTGPVPRRSRVGNAVTRVAFAAATGRGLVDTQTGLRGFPASLLPWLVAVPGRRFEYELHQLLRAVREGLAIEQVDIETVYLEQNASSHFRPVVDSVRIYRPLLAFGASSLVAFAVDTLALLLLVAGTGNLVLAAVVARLLSGSVNYAINRRIVFRSRDGGRWRTALRYAALAAGVLVANVLLLEVLVPALGSVAWAKVVTEVTLFVLGFVVQRNVVFSGSQRLRQRDPATRAREALSERG